MRRRKCAASVKAARIFSLALGNKWGMPRTAAHMLVTMVLDDEEWRLFEKVLSLTSGLLDLDFIKCARSVQEILSASGDLMGEPLTVRQVARLSYAHVLAGRSNWPPKQPEREEAATRSSSTIERRTFDGSSWTELSYNRACEDDLRQVVNGRNRRRDPTLNEHNAVGSITGPTGHSGGGLTANHFNLVGMKGLKDDEPLSGKRKPHMMLKPICASEFAHYQPSKRIKKVEPGKLGRGLYPLSYDTSLASEYLEKGSKIILESSEYSQLEKSYAMACSFHSHFLFFNVLVPNQQ